jgi:RNA polymerase sigma factor (sigma-70 family)
MAQYSDQDIIVHIKNPATAEKGCSMLMSTYQERLYYAIRRIINTHDDADDVLQNTFIKAYQNFASFEGRSSLYTWLYKIATNEAITFTQVAYNRRKVAIDTANVIERGTEEVEALEINTKLEKAIETLPEKQKQVFNLRYYDEMSYQDMSDLLQTSIGALKASYHIAAKKVEASLTA